MSLTRQVKQELVRLEESLTCCSSWELKAFLLRNGYYTIRHNMHVLIITADDSAVARRLFNLLRQAGVISPSIIRQQVKRLRKDRFLVQVHGSEQIDALLVYLDLKDAGRYLSFSRLNTVIPKRICCRKAFVRGVFLAGGSISISKRSGYHLEVNCGNIDDAHVYQKVLGYFNLYPLIRKREDFVFVYLKSAEAIADYLRIIGAGSTLLQIESLRVVKSMRNQVNRTVNCETANLEKVVTSAQHQLELIDQADHLIGLDNLPATLREVALIRRNYPDASLKELGKMLDPPVSKSAVNHRFRRLGKMFAKTGVTINERKPRQPAIKRAGITSGMSK